MTVTPQLKAILLAGGLAAMALVLGFMTLARNQAESSAGTARPIVPLHLRSTAGVKAKPVATAARPSPKPVDPNVQAALDGGLPKPVAAEFATHRVVVVMLWSASDQVDDLARNESQLGAQLAGAGFVAVNVDRDGESAAFAKLLGALPPAPAALVYARPAKLYVSLPGFNDHITIQQAAANAEGA